MRRFVLTAMLCTAASVTQSAEYFFSGTVAKIIAVDSRAYGVDMSHILVTGLASAGSCPTNDGLVALVLRDDEGGRRQLTVALAAKASNSVVYVRVNDDYQRPGGSCYLKYIEVR